MKKIIFILLLVLLFNMGCVNDKYTITFVGYNGEIIEVIEIDEETNIIPPTVTPPEGKKFIGWNKAFDSITSDTVINAIFEDIQTVTITQTIVSPASISLYITNTISDIKLYNVDIYNGNSFIKDIEFNNELVISDLQSNKEYIIKYVFNGEALEYKFKTLPIDPTVSIEIVSISSNTISININEDDADNIGDIESVQLFKEDALIDEIKETDIIHNENIIKTIIFDNLEANTNYLIVLKYYNNYKEELITKELNITTEKEIIIPEIDIMNIDINYNNISFDVMGKINESIDYITDNDLYKDISFMIKGLTLYKGEEVVTKINDVRERINIKDLEENTDYKLEFMYSYVIDNETIEKVIIKDITTLDYFSSTFEYEIITHKPNSIKILGLKNDIVNLIIPNECIIDDISYKITEIGMEAFCNNSLIESVTIGKNISLVESYAFTNCINLKEIYFEKVDKEIDIVIFQNGIFRNCVSLTEIDFTNTKCFAISHRMFSGCINLKTVKLEGIEDFIDGFAFENCKELTTIENGLCISSANKGAFLNCEKLENVNFPKIKIIFERAFENCVSMKTFNFDEVEKIGEYAFNNCSSLGEIYLPLSVEMIVSKAFTNCPLLIINTAHETKPELWYDGFKDNQTIINYNVTKKEE